MRLMWVARYFFSYFGRTNRAKYWLGLAIVYGWYALLGFAWSMGKSDRGVWDGTFGLLMIVGLISMFSLFVKRIHDLDISGAWVGGAFLLFGVISISRSEYATTATSLAYAAGMIWLGSAKGTAGNNRFGADPLKPRGVDPKQTDAYQMGQKFSGEMWSAFTGYFDSRFLPVRENYLNVLRQLVRQSFNSQDGPPLTIARVEYRVFLNRIKELEDQIFGESCDAMHEWLDVADGMGVRAETESGFRTHIKEFCNDLTIAGMSVLTDYAIPLRDADRDWRAANPKRAKEFPPEQEGQASVRGQH
jgi:uncharacterized membrane protein YhaH (DUF805 family)